MIKLPALPALKDYLNSDDGTPVDHWFDRRVRARDIEVARVVLEAAAEVCDAEATLTPAGTALYEGVWGGATNCAAAIRAIKIEGETT